MRRLTFRGYLRQYVPYLAGTESRALSNLAAAAQKEPRAVEPLLLMAVVDGRADELGMLLEHDKALHSELLMLDQLHRQGELESALANDESRLRVEYVKVWRSFASRRDASKRDQDLKLLARERALRLEETRHVTRYRMAKDLGLNPGNLHAFLAQGNVKKLSLDRAYQLVEYLEAA